MKMDASLFKREGVEMKMESQEVKVDAWVFVAYASIFAGDVSVFKRYAYICYGDAYLVKRGVQESKRDTSLFRWDSGGRIWEAGVLERDASLFPGAGWKSKRESGAAAHWSPGTAAVLGCELRGVRAPAIGPGGETPPELASGDACGTGDSVRRRAREPAAAALP